MKIGLALATLLTAVITGCALTPPVLPGADLVADGDLEKSIDRLSQAIKDKPDVIQYRSLLARTTEAFVGQQVLQGEEALRTGDLETAEQRFKNALRYHSNNAQAQTGLTKVGNAKRSQILLQDAQAAIDNGQFEAARSLSRAVLAREPAQADAARLLKEAETKMGRNREVDSLQLAARLRRPVSLRFKDVPIKSLFDALGSEGGLNFIFDRDFNGEQVASLIAVDTPLSDALDMLLASNQLAKKTLNANTLLIYPANLTKHREYQDTVVKSFFLSHANAKDTMNLIKGMGKIRDVYIDERLNMVAVRDTPEAVRLAEKLVTMTDRPEAEVMLYVEIMEVSGNKLQELGLRFPSQFSALGGEVGSSLQDSAQLTLRELRDLNSSRIGVSPNPALNLLRVDGDLNLLANPRIRVKNKEKARIHIGDKLPVITSTISGTSGFSSESVNYLDVGLKFDVEPVIRLDGDVDMKVALEVSNVAGTIRTDSGTVAYQLGSRNATTVLRLRDGETQVLAGLISDSERSSANKLPGLGQLPMVGRLFSSSREEASKSEIILLITPRILRNISRPELSEGEFFAGTEGATSDQALRLRPAPVRIERSPTVTPDPEPSTPAPQPQPAPGLIFPPPTSGTSKP
jgi:general secretion pathway protein D